MEIPVVSQVTPLTESLEIRVLAVLRRVVQMGHREDTPDAALELPIELRTPTAVRAVRAAATTDALAASQGALESDSPADRRPLLRVAFPVLRSDRHGSLLRRHRIRYSPSCQVGLPGRGLCLWTIQPTADRMSPSMSPRWITLGQRIVSQGGGPDWLEIGRPEASFYIARIDEALALWDYCLRSGVLDPRLSDRPEVSQLRELRMQLQAIYDSLSGVGRIERSRIDRILSDASDLFARLCEPATARRFLPQPRPPSSILDLRRLPITPILDWSRTGSVFEWRREPGSEIFEEYRMRGGAVFLGQGIHGADAEKWLERLRKASDAIQNRKIYDLIEKGLEGAIKKNRDVAIPIPGAVTWQTFIENAEKAKAAMAPALKPATGARGFLSMLARRYFPALR